MQKIAGLPFRHPKKGGTPEGRSALVTDATQTAMETSEMQIYTKKFNARRAAQRAGFAQVAAAMATPRPAGELAAEAVLARIGAG